MCTNAALFRERSVIIYSNVQTTPSVLCCVVCVVCVMALSCRGGARATGQTAPFIYYINESDREHTTNTQHFGG